MSPSREGRERGSACGCVFDKGTPLWPRLRIYGRPRPYAVLEERLRRGQAEPGTSALHPPTCCPKTLSSFLFAGSANCSKLKPHTQPGHRSSRPSDGTTIPRLAHSYRPTHIRLASQANILIDSNGTAHISGFAGASFFPVPLPLGDKTGTGKSDQNRDPDSALAQPPEAVLDSLLFAKASDMSDFGSIAWEVRVDLFLCGDSIHLPRIDSHRPTTVLWHVPDCSNILDAERS